MTTAGHPAARMKYRENERGQDARDTTSSEYQENERGQDARDTTSIEEQYET